MGLETTFDFIDELNPAWPLATDPKSEGDDHLRGIKLAVQGNIKGSSSSTTLKLNGVDGLVITGSGATHFKPGVGLSAYTLNVAGVSRGGVRAQTTAMDLQSAVSGIAMRLRVTGATGEQSGIELTPQGKASVRFDGAEKLRTTALGAEVVNALTGSSLPVLGMIDGAGNATLTFSGISLAGAGKVDARQSLQLSSGGQIGIQIDNGPTFFSGGLKNASFASNVLYLNTAGDSFAGAQASVNFISQSGATAWGQLLFSGTGNYLALLADFPGMRLDFYTKDAGSVQRVMAQADPTYGWSWFRDGNNLALRTKASANIGNSYVEVVDSTGATRPVGFNVMQRIDVATSRSLTVADVGGMLAMSASLTITVPASVFGFGEIISFINNSGNNCVISPGSGYSIVYISGGASLTGARTIAANSIVTIWCVNSTSCFMWGNGIT